MRTFNAAFFVAVVMVLALAFERGKRAPLLWGVPIALVPLGMFIVPSVNPSSWAVISGATFWLAILGFFRATKRSKLLVFGFLAVLLAAIGAGARGDAALFLSLSALVASVLTFTPTWAWMKRALLPLGLAVFGWAVFVSVGQSSGYAGLGESTDKALTLNELTKSTLLNLTQLQSLWIGNSGYWRLGWLDTELPPIVWVTMVCAFSGLAFWGLRVLDFRKAVSLVLVISGLIALPLYILARDQLVVGEEVQPRYLLPLMLIFAGLAVHGFKRDNLGMSKVQAILVVAGLTVANSVALHTNINRYTSGSDVRSVNLDNQVEWWWSMSLSPMAVWFLGTASFASVMGAVLYAAFVRADSKEIDRKIRGFLVS